MLGSTLREACLEQDKVSLGIRRKQALESPYARRYLSCIHSIASTLSQPAVVQAREEGEVAGYAPILSGRALREAWLDQEQTTAGKRVDEAPKNPSETRVVVLDDSAAAVGSEARRVAYEDPSGDFFWPCLV